MGGIRGLLGAGPNAKLTLSNPLHAGVLGGVHGLRGDAAALAHNP